MQVTPIRTTHELRYIGWGVCVCVCVCVCACVCLLGVTKHRYVMLSTNNTRVLRTLVHISERTGVQVSLTIAVLRACVLRFELCCDSRTPVAVLES